MQESYYLAAMAGDIDEVIIIFKEMEQLKKDFYWEPPEVHNKKQMAKLGRGRIF